MPLLGWGTPFLTSNTPPGPHPNAPQWLGVGSPFLTPNVHPSTHPSDSQWLGRGDPKCPL